MRKNYRIFVGEVPRIFQSPVVRQLDKLAAYSRNLSPIIKSGPSDNLLFLVDENLRVWVEPTRDDADSLSSVIRNSVTGFDYWGRGNSCLGRARCFLDPVSTEPYLLFQVHPGDEDIIEVIRVAQAEMSGLFLGDSDYLWFLLAKDFGRHKDGSDNIVEERVSVYLLNGSEEQAGSFIRSAASDTGGPALEARVSDLLKRKSPRDLLAVYYSDEDLVASLESSVGTRDICYLDHRSNTAQAAQALGVFLGEKLDCSVDNLELYTVNN